MASYYLDKKRFPNIPERLKGLATLAENLWWSWNPQARVLFKMLDRQAWKESGHNPDRMLRNLPERVLEEATIDANYLRHYDLVMYLFETYLRETPVYPGAENDGDVLPVAYFSLEYGLHHSLPFYAGGLGFLAGDHLKEASDLGIPLVAIGFMYPAGYLYQVINNEGWQENFTQELDKETASINRVMGEDGKQLTVEVPYIGESSVVVGIWKVSVGRVSLYLMDTDLEQNDDDIRSISQRLYTSDAHQRLLQEIILGIGGSRVFEALGQDCCMMHLNEGHAAFALLEKIRQFMEAGDDFETARQKLAPMSLFTTHTPVPAGHDIFPFEWMDQYFGDYWPRLGLSRDAFMDLGRNPSDPDAGFNMTALAMRLSGNVNAVSKKHGEVTRQMWHGMWPDLAAEEVPVDHVTNGVHLATWLEPKIKLLLNRYFGQGWMSVHDNAAIWEFIEEIPDRELWQAHYWLKLKLINHIGAKARKRWGSGELDPSQAAAMGTMLDPSVLTLGFARRFTTYKRSDLIFKNLERLKKIVNDPWRPVQVVFAGKAHPDDTAGHELINRVFNLSRDPALSGRIAFVEDYNEQLAQYLVHGVDAWLNNPLPPMEASGTSGMKAALNGVPHLSIPDGWWLEGFNGKNGWTFGDEGENPDRDEADVEAFYDLLEGTVIPLYYQAAEDGTPHGWVRIMKESMKTCAPRFSARRMVKEYCEKYYQHALKAPS